MAPSGPIAIVLADDDEDLRAVTAAQLRASGMTVWEANDGTQAVALVREQHPAVLVLDLWMPGLDGLQVLDALRFDPAASRMAVVVLTGDGEADAHLHALAGGAAATLLKGGPVAALLDAVRSGVDRAVGAPFGIDPDEHDIDDDGADDTADPLAVPSRADRDAHPSGPDLP